MDVVRTFLESSTIHGLNLISRSRKHNRLFWILVVVAGFTSAAYLIKTSFEAWTESPIKTTIETLSISEIKLPKVTVCPPKNTYTDLNYDLMLAENFTLTEEMRDELIGFTEKVIEEHIFTDDLDILQENDRYYNWYNGSSQINRVYNDYVGLNYNIYMSATSGDVTTQYFGEQYQSSLVRRKVLYQAWVYPPESVSDNKNVTLHFILERLSMNEYLSKGSLPKKITNVKNEPFWFLMLPKIFPYTLKLYSRYSNLGDFSDDWSATDV